MRFARYQKLQHAQGMQDQANVRSAYRRVVNAIERAARIYRRPHVPRENTVLFSKLRGLVSAHEYEAMAKLFEKSQS
jgi:hypothetical protein